MGAEHIHDISGFLPALNLGPLVLPTYFVISSLAFIAALFFLVHRAKNLRLPRNRALDTALVLMLTGFVGSRLFHVFFEEPGYYAEDPSRVLEIWRGGFVWFGGAVFGSLCSLWFLKWKREPIARYLDLFAPVGALGYAIGRLACLFTGCCYGAVCILPGMREGYAFRYPTQALAVVYEVVVLFILLKVERTREDSPWFGRAGQLFLLWVILHGAGRILMESLRGDPRGAFIFGLSISTWISAILIVGSFVWLRKRSRKM